jgi:hypothetical protein
MLDVGGECRICVDVLANLLARIRNFVARPKMLTGSWPAWPTNARREYARCHQSTIIFDQATISARIASLIETALFMRMMPSSLSARAAEQAIATVMAKGSNEARLSLSGA